MIRTVLFCACLLSAPEAAWAQDLAPKAAGEVVDQLVAGLSTYVDPALGKAAQARLTARRPAYMALDTREAFAVAVSQDLFDVTHDKHLKVSVQTVDAQASARLTEAQQALLDQHLAYGLMAIRRLPGNIGYLKLSYFEQTEPGAALINAAMTMLKGADALIIDLRENGGGGGASDEALLGHLSRTPIPMARITYRNPDGTTEVVQRAPATPAGGPLYPDKPVFVLTANRTFSAAEGFAYDLKAVGRATLVGETTRGGANPSNRPVRLGYGFRVFVPNGRVEHPVTRTNWEGVGVTPDVVTPPAEALTEAYRRALAVVKPAVATVKSQQELERARSDPKAALVADQAL